MSITKVGRFDIHASEEGFFNSLKKHLTHGESCEYFTCMNPHSYAVSVKDDEFYDAVKASKWIVPDGVGLIIASFFNKNRIQHRITGMDVFEFLIKFCNEQNKSIFLLGSSQETLDNMVIKFSKDFPSLKVAGTYSPPFKDKFSDLDNIKMVEKVNKSSADIVFVSMTAPKQEKWIFKNKEVLKPILLCPIGAVFDFYVGNIKRPHKVFRNFGLEWLGRFIQEPKRLLKRITVSPIIFLFDIIKVNIGFKK